jgi:putative MATE family efflux protein
MRWSALGSLQTAVPGASLYSQHPMNSAASPSASPSASTQRRARLLTAPVLPALLALAAPNVALALMQALVSFADGWFIGQLGTEGLAGVALVFPIVILMQMMSAGAMGGGVSSAIARALGAGDADRAERLAWHAAAIAVAFGLLFTVVMLLAGPALFRLLGGRGEVLTQATAYSNIVFGGALTVWLANILANVVRGTGNMIAPSVVLSAAAVLQIPLCGALVLGWGPFPMMGIRGAAIAYVIAFGAAALCFAVYIHAGRTGLHVRNARRAGVAFSRQLFADILRVGLLSSFNAVQTIAAAVIVTGLVGTFGTAALAGYGLGVRLELLQIPVVFAIGAALVVMVGTCIGAGDVARARRVAWTGAALAAAATGGVGTIVAIWPGVWASLFSSDADVLAAAYGYLRIAGWCYAFFGVGIALYFASQGAGRMLWPVLAGSARFVIAVAGGYLALRYFGDTPAGVFAAIGLAMIAYGAGMIAVVKWGGWR